MVDYPWDELESERLKPTKYPEDQYPYSRIAKKRNNRIPQSKSSIPKQPSAKKPQRKAYSTTSILRLDLRLRKQ